MSVPSLCGSNGGALNKLNICLFALSLIMTLLWNTSSVAGAPAKLDSLESPFPLDLQPPVFEASSTAYNGDSDGKTIDSYGNPIESLQPIETPDGRKVVSAQGLQFEIPNYASGITELKKPSDDLLPPFVGELSNDFDKTTTTATTSEGHNNDDKQGRSQIDDNEAINDNNNNSVELSSLNIDESIGQPHLMRIERQPKLQNNNYQPTDINNLNINTLQQQQQEQQQLINNDDNLINLTKTNTNVALATSTNQTNQQLLTDHKQLTTPPSHSPSPSPPSSITNSLSLFVNKQINKPKSLSFQTPLLSSPSATFTSSSSSPLEFTTTHDSLKSPFSKSKLTAQYAPISNGNFNYPNIPTDLSIIDRIASKYKNPLPTLDPIVVALPDDDNTATLTTNVSPSSAAPSSSSAETTTVDVENVPLLEIQSESATSQETKDPSALFQGLPQYILDLNDPNIAGPVDYVPDNKGLKVIAWDLMPPYENDVETINDQNQISSQEYTNPTTTGEPSLNAQATQDQVSVVDLQTQHSQTSQVTEKPQIGSEASSEIAAKPNFSLQNRGSVHYSSTTQRPTTTTTRRPTTTTTPRTTTTTTPRTTTTTTRRSTTPRTTRATTTTTTTTAEPDTSEFYKLEAGDSYTLPPWLQDIDDPELDVAVSYIEPEDLKEYNQTIDRDILPPFEPFTDLNNIHLTTPSSSNKKVSTTTTPKTTTTTTRRSTTTTSTTARPTTSTTTTTTTTRRPTLSTSIPHWIRAKTTTTTTTTKPFISNNQFTNNFNHNQDSNNPVPSIVSSNNFAQRTTTTSTTVKPKTTVNYYNRPLSNTPKTDKITSAEANEGIPQKSKNPFLNSYNDGSYRPQPTTTRRTTTTTTTTTTTAAPEVDRNPFEPTIPPWLKDFDYPDVGPGVPFVYDPNDDDSDVNKDLMPPSELSETDIKPTLLTSPSSTSSLAFVNSPTPQGFTNNKFSNSATTLTSSSSIPSKVTIPLPSTQQQTNQDDSTVSQPPLVFVPPPPIGAEDDIIANADAITKKTSSSFNKNFAAPFDPTASSSTSSDDTTNKIPLGADRESFPPFNNVVTDGSTTGSAVPSKTTFSKSEDGKVITKNVFLNSAIGSASSKPFTASNTVDNQQKDTFVTQSSTQFGGQGFSGSAFTKATTASTIFKQFGTTAVGASGFVTSGGAATSSSSSFGATTFGSTQTSSSSIAGGSKYTGRFGGPPGVLAPQNSGFLAPQRSGFTTASPVTSSSYYNRPSATTVGNLNAAASSISYTNKDKFTGSFGGPPGVLQPYDNVKNRN